MKNIAKAVHLSKDTVSYRINKLVKNKIIHKFLALVNFSAFGYDQYYVGLQLQNLDSKKEKIITDKLTNHKFVFAMFKTSGRFDFYIGLACKGVQHFDNVLREIYSICGNNLMDSETVTWIKDLKYTHTIEGIKLGTVFHYKKEDLLFQKNFLPKEKSLRLRKLMLMMLI